MKMVNWWGKRTMAHQTFLHGAYMPCISWSWEWRNQMTMVIFWKTFSLFVCPEIKVNMFNIMKEINKINKQREQKELCSLPMKGHSFVTIQNSKISNLFMNTNSSTSDSIVKYAICGRCNSLRIGELLKRKEGENASWGNCGVCNQLESLQHILNGCQNRKYKYTASQNGAILFWMWKFLRCE